MLGSLARRAGVVALGTAGGQAAVLLATPWMARQFTPAEFGALALLITISNVAMAAACLRFDLALPSAAARQAGALLRLCLLSALGVGFAMLAGTALYPALTGSRVPAPFSTPWLVGLCILVVGWHQTALGWTTRQQAFAQLGAIRLFQGLGFVALTLLTPLGLLWSHAASFLSALPSLWQGLRHTRTEQPLRQVAIEQRQFPLASLPGALLDVVGYSLCVWIVTRAYGVAEAGQYAQVQRLVGAPLMLLAMSLGQVMLGHTASLRDNSHALAKLVAQAFRLLAACAVSVVILVVLWGEPTLRWLLGSQWRVDTEFIAPIALAVGVRACVSPLTMVLITLQRFDLALRWQIAYFASASVVFITMASWLSLGGFVFVYAIHECVFYLIYLLLIRAAIRSKCAASSA
ncbi:MAG TPA: oligosaccharide flippase family protein [Alicycliphilus sp.]|nr:oligosaccharide flippase family protein [Alicycliphilus sp.]